MGIQNNEKMKERIKGGEMKIKSNERENESSLKLEKEQGNKTERKVKNEKEKHLKEKR